MTATLTRSQSAGILLLVSALACSSLAMGEEAKSARKLMTESGVQGGLIVHVGTADVEETAALRLNQRYLVQGLCSDAARIPEARRRLVEMGLAGAVTVIPWRGGSLPYADNLVNLLIARDLEGPSMDEVMRVLAPHGVAYVKSDGGWTRRVKPWPEEIDEWTHFLHAPDNNAVAEDTRIAPPHHLQWVAGPRWGRSHDHLASMSAAVSAAGRIFSIVDEGPIASVMEPSQWRLVARDAFSGVLLWKKKIGPWENHLRPFRSGPAELPRRLVAVGDRVYVTLGYGKPVTALDAATGDAVHTYPGTENAHEILCHEGKLYLVIGEPLSGPTGTSGELIRRLPPWRDFYNQYVTRFPPKHVQCLDAETGKLAWKKKDADTEHVLPITLAVADGRVFFENERRIVALDADSGEVVWQAARPVSFHRYAWSTPTLVVHDGVVLSADRSSEAELDTGGEDETKLEWLVTSDHLLTGGEMTAFSAATGEKLWTVPCHEGFNFPVDVLVAHGKVYSGELAWGRQPGITQVYDLHTGEVVAKRPPDQECYTIGFGHARCYRNKATTKYLIHGRSGVEFLDMASDRVIADHWIRGTCQYGILPANGLLYVPPHSCACYIEGKLSGFHALAARRGEGQRTKDEGDHTGRLQRGPAFGRVAASAQSQGPSPDWPTHRHDGRRSGAAGCSLSHKLKHAWEKAFAGPLTSAVIADGKLLFAQKDAHTVHALHAADGAPRWQYTAGGRIDSPPTVHGGLVYFGSADGWVYCLRAGDGMLVWRFRAAPRLRQIVSYDQLESVWPVHGSVLVRQDRDSSSPPVVYAVAGRSSFLDRGMFLCRLDARTGGLLSEHRISHRDPETGQEPQETVRGVSMAGALPDVLTTDGSSVFMRHMRFDTQGNLMPQDVAHLFSSVGFLDDSWWHRTYWQVGTTMRGGYGGWPQVGNRRISGRLLVLGGARVFGFGRKEYGVTGSHAGLNAEYHLFAADAKLIQPKPAEGAKQKPRRTRLPATEVRYHWSKPLPFYARAMVLAGDTLFVAGPRDLLDFAAESPKHGVWLWAFSADDGSRRAEYELKACPVFDSLAAAAGRLYFTTVDGRVVCYQSEK
jgi:outer membrane protein assembly factor BamB